MRAAFYFDSTAVRIFRSNVFDGKADCFSHDVSQPYVSLRVCGIITAFCAPMAQRIEHRTSNPTVAGSSPAGRAISCAGKQLFPCENKRFAKKFVT